MNQPTAAAILQPSWDAPISKEIVLQQWLDASAKLAEAKEAEQVLRKQVVSLFPFDPNKKEGIEYLNLANGYKLKAQKKLNYVLDKESIESALDLIEAEGETGKLLAERLVKWKPELSISEYRQLPEDYKKIVDKAVTTKDGMPTLELIEPKGK